jgi:hypothetical protein
MAKSIANMSTQSGKSLRSQFQAPQDGVAAMVHGLLRLPPQEMRKLTSLSEKALRQLIVGLDTEENRDADEAELDAMDAQPPTEPVRKPFIAASLVAPSRPLDQLLQELQDNPALREASPKIYRRGHHR